MTIKTEVETSIIDRRLAAFDKDVRAYFFSSGLSDYDFKKLGEIFTRNNTKEKDIHVEREYKTIRVVERVSLPPTTNICPVCLEKSKILQDRDYIQLEDIEKIVCEYFGMPPADIKNKKRNRDKAYARQVIFYFASRYTILSLKDIGIRYNRRDHTTVIHGKTKIKDFLDAEDAQTVAAVRDIERILLDKFKKLQSVNNSDLVL